MGVSPGTSPWQAPIIQGAHNIKTVHMPNPEEWVVAGETGVKALEVGRLPGLLDLLGEGAPASKAAIKSAFQLAPDEVALNRLIDMGGTKLGLTMGQIDRITPYDWKFLESKIAFGDLSLPGRGSQPVFLHVVGEADHAPYPEVIERLRKEPAAQFISANLFNTVPKAALRQLQIGPGVLLTQADSIEHLPIIADTEIGKSAQSLYGAILEHKPVQVLVSQDVGYSLDVHPALKGLTDESKFAVLSSKPAASKALERSIVEREILGDDDGHFGNFALSGGLTRSQIGTLDPEMAFKEGGVPIWDNAYVYHDWAGQPLRTDTVSTVNRFVRSFGTPRGIDVLKNMQLTGPEIDGMLSRANWFAENKTFPQLVD